MTINLTSYKSIQSNLFVRIQVDSYRTTAGGGYTAEVLKFSDMLTPFTINSEVYTGLGRLMSVSSSSSEIRVSGGQVTITLSGIPNSSIYEILHSKIKGCPVRIYRAIFDASTGAFLNIAGNPLGRYRGFVNNYSLNEDFDNATGTSSNTLVLVCSSSVDVLQNKLSGRKTNPDSFKKTATLGSADTSMDRVPNLENATFNFGAPS